MDKNELARIRAQLETGYDDLVIPAREWDTCDRYEDAIRTAEKDLRALLAEVERLRAVEAAAREMDVEYVRGANVWGAWKQLHDALKGAN